MKKFSDCENGDAVCDMHDGIESIHAQFEDHIQVIGHLSFNCEGSTECVKKLIAPRMYTNKHLVLVEDLPQADGSTIYKCVYSYDDRIFGAVALKVWPKLPPLKAPEKPPVPKLTVRRDIGTRQFEADPGTAGTPIVGRGASILEAVGEYVIQAGLVNIVADPPERIDDSYRINPTVNTAKVELVGCDRR